MMRRILVLSLVLNGILAAVIFYGLRSRGGAEVAPAPAAADLPAMAGVTNPVPKAKPGVGVPAPGIQSWRDIESADYTQYIANLRKIGCPEETIADIIISEVNGLYRARLARFPTAKRPEYKYWETRGNWQDWLRPKLDPGTEKARWDLEFEKRESLRQLLGSAYAEYDLPDKTALRWESDPFFAALPAQKRGEVLGITRHYDLQMERLREHRQRFLDEDDRKELARLQKEKERAVGALLAPAELEEFEMRFSEAAESVRNMVLPVFDASEEEFRALCAARREMVAISAGDQVEGSGQAGEKAARLQAVEDNLKAKLGEERYQQVAALLRR